MAEENVEYVEVPCNNPAPVCMGSGKRKMLKEGEWKKTREAMERKGINGGKHVGA